MTTRLFNIDAIGEMHFKKEYKNTKKKLEIIEEKIVIFRSNLIHEL